ncbi:MAG: substrate-binding domain-containing protein [Planctomycetaceae bacterium]|nr:substrate-binding domain-containing protein [Planctomycetaceae bacterium]
MRGSSWFLTLGTLAVFAVGCGPEIPQAAAPSDGSATTSGTAPSDSTARKRLIVLTNGNSPYWDACRAGILDANRELDLEAKGFVGVMEVNDGTPQGQLDKLRQFGSQADVAGIGVSAIDAANSAIAEELRALQKKGIAVVTIDSDVDRDKFRDARFAFIGTDNLAGGVVLGKTAAALRPDGGEYVTFVGRTGAQNAIERIGGFAQGAGSGFTSKDSMQDENDDSRARENVRNALINNPDLRTLVGIWSYNAPAIVDVVRERKLDKSQYTVVCFDAEPLAIQAMAGNQIDALVVQNPYRMGYDGVRLLHALVAKDQETIASMYPRHGQPDGDLLDTGLKVVIPNDQSPAKSADYGSNVEVLTLEAFKGWLEQNGLTGS